MRHFIDVADSSREELEHILRSAAELRAAAPLFAGASGHGCLTNKRLAMLLQKPSLRTRVSFEVAVLQLGGSLLTLLPDEVGLGKRESVADVARVLGRMVDGIIARVYDHGTLLRLAEHSGVRVINALSDRSHPCQALADLLTIRDEFGSDLAERHVVFVGDGNNVALSLAEICLAFGLRFTLVCPRGYAGELERKRQISPQHRSLLAIESSVEQAVGDADVIYTDTWVSMGQEGGAEARRQALGPYQVNDALLDRCPDHTIVMHCLPAHRGEEITDAAIDGSRSRVFAQAENRLHAQRGLLSIMFHG
ncbi:MAG: ornithine carbamoyltransferase [Phycisphaeraceae bacterium]|nr:ornithine carbamoyltransferase [Phycisphaeraceae bacterium]